VLSGGEKVKGESNTSAGKFIVHCYRLAVDGLLPSRAILIQSIVISLYLGIVPLGKKLGLALWFHRMENKVSPLQNFYTFVFWAYVGKRQGKLVLR